MPNKETRAEIEGQRFVVHKHAARQLHYDFRLEIEVVLKSWAIPKGPCLDPLKKRLAVQVEDHAIDFIDFEGVIPRGEYGAGSIIVWDRGTWSADDDLSAAYRLGKLKFCLHGEKLKGGWTLVKIGTGPDATSGSRWLLIKERDTEARDLQEYDVLTHQPTSVISGRTVDEVSGDAG